MSRSVSEVDFHRPMISWGAIIAGAFVAFIVNVGLLSLGSAIGFNTFDPAAGDTLGRGALIGAGIFTVVIALAAFFSGAFVAAKMAGYRVRSVSALHGIATWAVVSTMTILLVGVGISKVAGAAFGLVGESVRGAAAVGASAAGSAVSASRDLDPGAIRDSIKKTAQQAGVNPNEIERKAKALPKEMAQAQADHGDGEKPLQREADRVANKIDMDSVSGVLAQKLGITKDQAKRLLEQGEDQVNATLSQLGEQGKTLGLQAAQATTEAAAKASWITFFILLLGAGAAFAGGIVGGPKDEYPRAI